MRVSLISEHASPLAALGGEDAGGQNVYVAALARGLAAQGHRVTVHTRRDDALLPGEVVVPDGYLVHHVDAGPPFAVPKDELLPYMPFFAAELARHWSARRPDVAHAHFWMSGMAALDAARPLGLPVVQTFHALGTVKRRFQGGADTSPRSRVATETRIVTEADLTVATCRDEVRELLAMGTRPERVQVVPCGVDLDVFTPDGPRWWPTAACGHATRVLSLGRLVERKGVDDLISALVAVPDAGLVVAGGPDADGLDGDPEVRRLRAIAGAVGVADRVTFVGRVSRQGAAALLRTADVVVCTPWYEPFGMVPVEAMACATPVVGSAVGGLLDTIVDGVTGVLVPPRRPDDIGAALADLTAQRATLARMGEAGRRRAVARYGWASVAARMAAAYRAALGAPSLAASGGAW
ncbi:MAG TPA: glycosyltransferase [Acidimicrobiales bacterium]|nr:glycosyltransferase [Acidimicrobiales bacterium]